MILSQNKIPESRIFKPYDGVYFVERNAAVTTSNEELNKAIRAYDKKDVRDTTLTIFNYGEGWLDKDSIPLGIWEFYAKTADDTEYLFKRGYYYYTSPEMFEIKNMYDSDEVLHSVTMLQRAQSENIPFVKSDVWDYFHENGTLWKSIDYQTSGIPVYAYIEIYPEGGSSMSLLLKDNPDEWLEGEVREFDDNGILFKKLEYCGFSEVMRKIYFNRDGSILKSEEAIPDETTISAYNW